MMGELIFTRGYWKGVKFAFFCYTRQRITEKLSRVNSPSESFKMSKFWLLITGTCVKRAQIVGESRDKIWMSYFRLFLLDLVETFTFL